jgi:HAD superfamily hydrolase (TIGR01509 family)
MSITAFIFDFGNVICSFDPQIFLARAQPYSSLSPDGLLAAFKQSHGTMREYETGLVTSEEFFARIRSACRLSVSKEDFIVAYTQIFAPIPSTYKLVRELKPRYKLGLLSNTNEWHFEYGIKPVEIFPLFDTVTLSYEVKAMKPAREIYFDALGKLGVPPAECFYIDDLEENVIAARELGMHAFLFRSGEELRESLTHLGVRIS